MEERSDPAGERTPSAGQRDETPIRVLCVDDPRLVEQVAEFLERESDRICAVYATSASDGLNVLSERRIDCVVSDYEMPGMDGIELLEAIREDRPDPPFILFMGRESEETAARAIEAGVDGYQQKRLGRDQHADPGNHIRNSVAKYLESVRADRFREEYVLAAETASDAFWVCDPSTGAMRLNGLHHFGYDSERVDPDFDWWIDAIRADDRDRIRRFTDSLLEGDGPAFDELTADRSQSSIEYRLQFGRGVRRLLRPRDTPVR